MKKKKTSRSVFTSVNFMISCPDTIARHLDRITSVIIMRANCVRSKINNIVSISKEFLKYEWKSSSSRQTHIRKCLLYEVKIYSRTALVRQKLQFHIIYSLRIERSETFGKLRTFVRS